MAVACDNLDCVVCATAFRVAFVREAYMVAEKWHMQEAEKLAQQLPQNMDDACAIVECLAKIIERAANADMEELLPGFCTMLQ
jgi:hypothetical protein